MNKILTKISNLFKENKIKYVLDSGTLLGIIREKNLILGDGDIDFAIWGEDIKKLENLLPDFIKLGYLIKKEYYRGLLYSYSLLPKKQDLIEVDIKIFREKDDFNWCPVRYANNSWKKDFSYYKSKFFRMPFLLLLKILPRSPLKRRASERILKEFFVSSTWVVSKDYLDKNKIINVLGFSVPKNWKGYLDYKYGEWRTPKKDWNYIIQDKTLIHKSPEELNLIKGYSNCASVYV